MSAADDLRDILARCPDARIWAMSCGCRIVTGPIDVVPQPEMHCPTHDHKVTVEEDDGEPCHDCGTWLPFDVQAVAIDSATVCMPCGTRRYGDALGEYLIVKEDTA